MLLYYLYTFCIEKKKSNGKSGMKGKGGKKEEGRGGGGGGG